MGPCLSWHARGPMRAASGDSRSGSRSLPRSSRPESKFGDRQAALHPRVHAAWVFTQAHDAVEHESGAGGRASSSGLRARCAACTCSVLARSFGLGGSAFHWLEVMGAMASVSTGQPAAIHACVPPSSTAICSAGTPNSGSSQAKNAASCSEVASSPVGATMGSSCCNCTPCMLAWDSSAVGSRTSTFLPSMSRFCRSPQKLTESASMMWPPTTSSTFLPFTVVNFGLSDKVLRLSRLSTTCTSLAWALSHSGVTSGPGNTPACAHPHKPNAAAPTQSRHGSLHRFIAMSVFMNVSAFSGKHATSPTYCFDGTEQFC
uniref:Uncharacterized protein n=1 Tax=mine drainage metagenome TaxID=410659 RepID=E6PUV1_9ZZZZ